MAKLHRKNSAPNPVGSPSVITEAVVAKLENVFAIDGSVEEACSYAEISRDAFYDYLKKNKEFSDKIEQLREKPVLKARQTAVQKLGESYTNAMDYLKRKRRREFGDSTDITTGFEPFPIYAGKSIQNNTSNGEIISDEKKD